jgi:predicted AlkP superfamily pyrophosphatase or phosphodiesterase
MEDARAALSYPLPMMMLSLFACVQPPEDTATASAPAPPVEQILVEGAEGVDTGGDGEQPLVVLISFDGFRSDYLSLFETPALDRLSAEGVTAGALVPVFPSKTFPNHYSQVTGLYPYAHGIVGNTFYDPQTASIFTMSSTESHWWGGEPIWVTAELQGRRTATCFWVGSEAVIKGVRPSEWLPYDGSMSDTARVAQVLEWIDEPDRPSLVTVYFSQVDGAGHSYGPAGPEVAAAVEEVDAALGLLLDGLESRGLLGEADVVVVSDHGMSQLSPDRLIFLDDYIEPYAQGTYILSWGAMVPVDVPESKVAETLAALAGVEHLTCAAKGEAPEHWHLGESDRIASVQCVAEDGWSITTRGWEDSYTGGTHGYDPQDASMGGIFLARGPHFSEGVAVAPFESVEIYNMLAHALSIEPAENHGDLSRVSGVLREPTKK